MSEYFQCPTCGAHVALIGVHVCKSSRESPNQVLPKFTEEDIRRIVREEIEALKSTTRWWSLK